MGSKQIDTEPSYKWVKRLRSNPLDPTVVTTKRFKIGDASSSGEMQNLLSRAVNYTTTISDLPEPQQHHHQQQQQQLDRTIISSAKNGRAVSPGEDSVKSMPWVRRWCCNSKEKSPQKAVLFHPENSNVAPEKFEAKQFPSLAAMALVGKQVTNFRPCEFRKRGSTVVWNI